MTKTKTEILAGMVLLAFAVSLVGAQTVNTPPVADPDGPYYENLGSPVTFDGSGSYDPDGIIVAYDWDFGDGNTDTGVSPIHTYATAGVYLVTLTVTDDGGLTDTYGTLAIITDISVVDIDIKPGSFPNSINPNAGGVIPVAILTTDTFDASTVDPETVALEGAGARGKGKSGNYGSMEDVDDDGDLDLVIQVVNEIDWAGITEATLTGNTWSGIAIEGTDSVNVVPPD
jgi:PKD repeat protein